MGPICEWGAAVEALAREIKHFLAHSPPAINCVCGMFVQGNSNRANDSAKKKRDLCAGRRW